MRDCRTDSHIEDNNREGKERYRDFTGVFTNLNEKGESNE